MATSATSRRSFGEALPLRPFGDETVLRLDPPDRRFRLAAPLRAGAPLASRNQSGMEKGLRETHDRFAELLADLKTKKAKT
jgi:hypothetical protein